MPSIVSLSVPGVVQSPGVGVHKWRDKTMDLLKKSLSPSGLLMWGVLWIDSCDPE